MMASDTQTLQSPALQDTIVMATGSRQIFLDDTLVESLRGVTRTFHPARKHPANPLVVPDKTWESKEVLLFGSVLHEPEGLWRMWYMSYFPNDALPSGNSKRVSFVGYAESADGLRWTKPDLDVYRFQEQRTNIVMGNFTHPEFREFHGVVSDDSDPARRYRTIFHTIGFCNDGRPGGVDRRYFSACSPDGIHWSDVREIPIQFPVNPDIAQFWQDPRTGQYVLWARAKFADEAVRARAPQNWFGRAVAILTSEDFVHWEDHGVVLAPDLEDPPAMDIYSLAAFRHGDIWIGLPQVYFQSKDDHRLEIQIACSRDGRHWTRLYDRHPVLPLGEAGEWDRFNQNTANAPVETEEETRLYYSGRTYRHPGYNGLDSGERFAAVGLATWRRDGYVSFDASFDGGLLLTRTLLLESPRIFLNLKADFGAVTIEALDMEDRTVAQAQLCIDSVRAEVRFENVSPHYQPTKVPFRLRIDLRNARLYAIWCE